MPSFREKLKIEVKTRKQVLFPKRNGSRIFMERNIASYLPESSQRRPPVPAPALWMSLPLAQALIVQM
jgi:hypothetical protein